MKCTIHELAEHSGGELLFGNPQATFDNIATSVSAVKGNDLYAPQLANEGGEHDCIGLAFKKGAVVSFREKDDCPKQLQEYSETKSLIKVDNVRQAVQSFMEYFRHQYIHIPMIGVTGSVGKTTTREMIAISLSSRKKVYSTEGNLNALGGVTQTVFKTDPQAEVGVIEMGIDAPGEMKPLGKIADVDIAVLTNIGLSHLAQLNTQENILKEKLQILSGDKTEGILLINGDDPLLSGLTEEKIHASGIAEHKKITIFKYGYGNNNDYRIENVIQNDAAYRFDFVTLTDERIPVSLAVYGSHMVLNAAAALAVSDLMQISLLEAAKSLSAFHGVEGRGKPVIRNGVTIFDDSFNAAPASMMSGLKMLDELPAEGRKIAVLADMKGLGVCEQQYHREIGDFINNEIHDLYALFTYGPMAALTADTVKRMQRVKVYSFDNIDELKKELYRALCRGDVLYLKGSHPMGLNTLLVRDSCKSFIKKIIPKRGRVVLKKLLIPFKN